MAIAVFLLLWLVPVGTTGRQDAPPREAGPFRSAELVEIVTLDPSIRLDIRYATAQNLAGRAVYDEASR
jgi:D-alanyl-D-alanine dipeptidase